MTDSRRVSGPDPAGGPQSIGTLASSPRPTRLAIRVWTPSRVDLRWTSESAVTYLISDLISAGGGSQVDEPGSGMAAQFDGPAEAFRTAKRIQWSLLEFSQHRPEQCLGAAVVIYDPAEVAAPGNASGELTTLLESMKPAQILATASTGTQLQGLPGLQFRAFPSSQRASSSWQRGIQELLWTTPANFERVHQTLKSLPQTLPRKEEQVAANETTADFGAMNRAAQATRIHTQPLPPADPVADIEQPNLLSELTDPEPRQGGSRGLWWSLAAVGVAAVIAAVILLPQLQHKRVNLDSPAATQSAPPPEPTTVSTNPEPPATEKAPASLPTSVEQPKTPPHVAPPIQPTHAQGKKASEGKTSESRVSEYEGWSEKDVPFLIRKAQTDAGAGKYDDARREFNIVLHLDSSNKDAKEGLHKLDLSEREAR